MTDLIILEIKCKFCGKLERRLVALEDYLAWMNGKSTQEAFAALAPIQREIFITGMCEECCKFMYGLFEAWENEDD